MDFTTLTYDTCRHYVNDHKGRIDESVINLILGWIRSRDISRLSSCPDHIPQAYHSEDLCRFSRQIAAFFKKNAAFTDPSTCTIAAQSAFEKAEVLCSITNRRLEYYYTHLDRLDDDLRKDVEAAESFIAEALGDIGDFYESLTQEIRVTAGATSTRSRRRSLPYLKVGIRNIPATKPAQPYLKTIATLLGYDKVSFKTVQTNRVETVPKNWKTDRTIACEPEGNLCLQLALDSFIKRKLRKYGINLSDQSWNQSLSRRASIEGNFATIDLSMASDTVSRNAVAWLLPREWNKLASDFRTPFGRGFGRMYRYNKFSSMGNGSTFAIETLIFTACCKAVKSKKFAVYGDDLVVPNAVVSRLLRLLRFLGFQVNESKSFTTGSFRESCGTDWFFGRDVTPFYMRCTNSMKIELCHLVNGLASIAFADGELEAYLGQLVTDHDLPLVPFNESSISGVWIIPKDARALGLIHPRKDHPWMEVFRAYVPYTRVRHVDDSRTYFLWHLDAARRQDRKPTRTYHPYLKGYNISFLDDCFSVIIRSEVPLFTHKYKRKRVSWVPHPGMVTPIHLFRWSDFLIRLTADKKVRT